MQRITNSMMTSRFLSNMKRNLNNMSTLQNQLASGKEILRPSQNPFAATRNKQLANQISDNEQYNANIKDTSNWLDTTDTALAQAGNVMARIKELMVKAGNGAYSEDEIATINNEVVEKSKELAQIMNTTFDGAYIFGGTKGTTKPVTVDANGNLSYADKDGNPLKVYLNIAGKVVNEPITNNAVLGKNDKIYVDADGNITASSKSEDGTTNNTEIISSGSLYMDPSGKITTKPDGNQSIVLKDNLYIDAKNNITTEPITDNKLLDTSSTIYYVTADGKVTTQLRSEGASVDNTVISTDKPIYVGTDGKVNINGGQLINWGDALYENLNGDVVINEQTINTKFNTSDPLYTDAQGNVTNVAQRPDGTFNTALAANAQLYVDENGNITSNGSGNNPIVLNEALYLDNNGDLMALKYQQTLPTGGTTINPNTSLYIDENGNITSKDGIQLDAGGNVIKENTKIIISDGLYLDKDDKITVSPTTPNVLIKTDDPLYVDDNGVVTTTKTNKLLETGTALYKDTDGNITLKISESVDGIPINRGEALYSDVNGRVTTSKTSDNRKLSADETLYVDPKNNVTLMKSSTNTALTLDDLKKMKEELKDPNITEDRKNEINAILKDEYAAQLLQIAEKLKVEISQGVVVEYNKTSSDILEYDDPKLGKVNVMDEISTLIKNLGILSDKKASEDDQKAASDYISGDGTTKMDSIIQNLLANRSQVGTMENRMESAMETNEDQNYNMTDILSSSEDIDFTEKTMEYAVMQTVYTAALQTSSKVLMNTIMDYI